MSSPLTNLKPELLWKYFDEIRKIPRESRHEEKIGEYLISVADKFNCKSRKDSVGNVVIEIPATKGYEDAPIVVLQGHQDMVCEKNSDVDHDFSKDPIKVKIEGDWVTADGTTLGADNGIGIAAGLALLEDDSVVHGPLELLFTTDEETGLNGANNLTSDFVKGKILLNLDSEESGAFFVGCAGGADTEITLKLNRKKSASGTGYKITLSGFRGGHSGLDIDKGRGNATKLLARMLFKTNTPFELVSIEGGNKHNAIPREAFAFIAVSDDKADELKKELEERFKEIAFEYKTVEKNAKWNMEKEDADASPVQNEEQEKLLNLIMAHPHGVMAMSQEIENLVETSTNLAIVKSKGEQASVYSSSRSSINSAIEAVRAGIEALGDLAGADVDQKEGYPGWTPDLDSELLKTMKKIHKDVTGEEPEVLAIHAGLECGIIGEKCPGMDMISFGPDLENPHSPDERVHIKSVEGFWELLAKTLEALAK